MKNEKKLFSRKDIEQILSYNKFNWWVQLGMSGGAHIDDYIDGIFSGVDFNAIAYYNSSKGLIYSSPSQLIDLYEKLGEKEKKYVVNVYEEIESIQNEKNKVKDVVKKQGYIYFLQNDKGHVKIGMTKNVKSRVKTIASSSSTPLLLIGYYGSDDCRKEELRRHELYKEYNVSGERFDLPIDDLRLRMSDYAVAREERFI